MTDEKVENKTEFKPQLRVRLMDMKQEGSREAKTHSLDYDGPLDITKILLFVFKEVEENHPEHLVYEVNFNGEVIHSGSRFFTPTYVVKDIRRKISSLMTKHNEDFQKYKKDVIIKLLEFTPLEELVNNINRVEMEEY